jgi:hypothetical protein
MIKISFNCKSFKDKIPLIKISCYFFLMLSKLFHKNNTIFGDIFQKYVSSAHKKNNLILRNTASCKHSEDRKLIV